MLNAVLNHLFTSSKWGSGPTLWTSWLFLNCYPSLDNWLKCPASTLKEPRAEHTLNIQQLSDEWGCGGFRNRLYFFSPVNSPRMNCFWTVPSVIPARSVEMRPPPPHLGSAGAKHISTVCDYTVSSTFSLVGADFIFVGCETLLSGVPRNAGWKDGYYA